jgi:hypothetical protein
MWLSPGADVVTSWRRCGQGPGLVAAARSRADAADRYAQDHALAREDRGEPLERELEEPAEVELGRARLDELELRVVPAQREPRAPAAREVLAQMWRRSGGGCGARTKRAGRAGDKQTNTRTTGSPGGPSRGRGTARAAKPSQMSPIPPYYCPYPDTPLPPTLPYPYISVLHPSILQRP